MKVIICVLGVIAALIAAAAVIAVSFGFVSLCLPWAPMWVKVSCYLAVMLLALNKQAPVDRYSFL